MVMQATTKFRLRMMICGPIGSGKTTTATRLAEYLGSKVIGSKVTRITNVDFDQSGIDAVENAASECDVLIIDPFPAWRDRPVTDDRTHYYYRMMTEILHSPCHVILTTYGDFQRGTEYEMDVVCDLDMSHRMNVSRSRCGLVNTGEFTSESNLMAPLIEWLSE